MSGIASERLCRQVLSRVKLPRFNVKSRFSPQENRSQAVNGNVACSESDCRAVNAIFVCPKRNTDFVALDLTSETQALLENLPAKAVVHFEVTAHNDAGESARSAVASVTLG
jgi:hypothetical protein